MSGFDWEGVLGADDPEEYMNILEDKIAEAAEESDYYTSMNENHDYPRNAKPSKPLPYKTSFSVNVNGVDEYINLSMGFKSYKTFNKFADEQMIPSPDDVNDFQSQVEKLYSFSNIITAGSLIIIPSIDFNLCNRFIPNSEFDIGSLSGKVNILSFLMANMMKIYSNNDYVQRWTNNGHYFWTQSSSIKTIYIFNGIFRKEMKKPLEDYINQLHKHYGDDTKIVLIALTEAQSNTVHFRLNAGDLANVIPYTSSIGINASDLKLPEDLKNKGLLLYNSNHSYNYVMQQLTTFDNIQKAKRTLFEDLNGLFIDIDCTFDSYTGRISNINLEPSDELQQIDNRRLPPLPF